MPTELTTAQVKEPGYYWLRIHPNCRSELVVVSFSHGEVSHKGFDGKEWVNCFPDARWIGPLASPFDTQRDKLFTAAERVVRDFEELDGSECKPSLGPCGLCIRCILVEAMKPGPHDTCRG